MNMTPERFAQLVEIHGSRPERWPADERMAAEAFRLADHQAQALGDEYARLEPRMDEYRDAMRPLRGEIFRAQVGVNGLLTEEQLNEEALNAAFDELREVAMRYLEITQQQTVEIFTQITPEQRVHAMSFMRERRDPGADDDR